MKGILGIRREDKNQWERRVPITPSDVKWLGENHGVKFVVQPSELRIYPEDQYEAAGATIDEDLSKCNLVMGVKEIPTTLLTPDTPYLYFSHTIKSQPYNMGMLARLMEIGCTLLDYEIIVDDQGRRTVFFGVHAGLAGMGETLLALGQKLDARSIANPFSSLRQPLEYDGLPGLKDAVTQVGRKIASEGLAQEQTPLVFGFTGYGNVSRGAQEILDLLPVIEIAPDELASLRKRDDVSRNHVYKVVFHEQHMVEPLAAAFELQEYYDHPERYRGIFETHLPHLDVLVNCIFWTERYPKVLTWEQARTTGNLLVVGDISCDIEGAVELTVKATMPDVPCFTVDPSSTTTTDGVLADGITIMSVDNLPCELPAEASKSFSSALRDLAPSMAATDWTRDITDRELPRAVRDAIIVHRGKLLPRFEFLEKPAREAGSAD